MSTVVTTPSQTSFLQHNIGEAVATLHVEFLVSSEVTARIQEAHKFLLHSLCELVEQQLEQGEG